MDQHHIDLHNSAEADVIILLIESIIQPGKSSLASAGQSYTISCHTIGTWANFDNEKGQWLMGTSLCVPPFAPRELPCLIVMGSPSISLEGVGSEVDDINGSALASRYLDIVRNGVQALRGNSSTSHILVETIPVCVQPIPIVQCWAPTPSPELLRYHIGFLYNRSLLQLAQEVNFWILDCDRALSRKGAYNLSPEELQDAYMHELFSVLSDSLILNNRNPFPQEGGY